MRNPCDVVLSCFMQPFIPNNAMNHFFNLEDATEFYNLVMKLWKKYHDTINLHLHIIKYENIQVFNLDHKYELLIKEISSNTH